MRKIHPAILVYVSAISATVAYSFFSKNISPMILMDVFMGIIFLVFGIAKVIDLKNFVYLYKKYDILAKKFTAYAYFYPFFELIIGAWFLLFGGSIILYLVTVIILFVNLASLYIVFVKKEDVMCVCLGSKCLFPFGKILVFENVFMILMVVYMLADLFFMQSMSSNVASPTQEHIHQ